MIYPPNQNLYDFFDKTQNKKRIFIFGDTGSGKSTGTLNYFIEKEIPKNLFYITSRKADLTEKYEYITDNFKNYTVYLHTTPNSPIHFDVRESKEKYPPEIHLMTIEKALFFLLNLSKNPLDPFKKEPDMFILDEIDSISENQNYELLTAFINAYYEQVKVVYISAVVNTNYIKTKLSNFFMLKNPDNSCYDLGKNNKNVVYIHRQLNTTLKKAVNYYLKDYVMNKEKYGQAIFIIQSLALVERVLENKDITSLGFFKINKSMQKKLETQFPGIYKSLSKIEKEALFHNFGIIDSRMKDEDRAIALSLFNSKQIPLLVSTNSIERGINVVTQSLFLFEGKNSNWLNSELINFYGRINRKKEKKSAGYFVFVSKREKSNPEIVTRRNEKITSLLTKERAALFEFQFPQMKGHFIASPEIDKSILQLSNYKKYSDGILYSLLEKQIMPNKERFDFILSNRDGIDRYTLIKDTINIARNEKQISENIIKYIYVKTIDALKLNQVDIWHAIKNVDILCDILMEQNSLSMFKVKHFPTAQKGIEEKILKAIADNDYDFVERKIKKTKEELVSFFDFFKKN